MNQRQVGRIPITVNLHARLTPEVFAYCGMGFRWELRGLQSGAEDARTPITVATALRCDPRASVWSACVFSVAFVFLASCGTTPETKLYRFEFQQPHMGTMFTIALYAPYQAKGRQASDAAFARVAELDQMMSDYDPESELMQLCKKPVGQPVRVSDELFDIIEKSQRVAELSGGAFDITVGPVVRLWRRARRTEELPNEELLAKARAAVGWKNLKLNPRDKTVTLTVPSMQLDLGGIAKGYAADQALAVLKSNGIPRALVAASGDIAVGDPPPSKPAWRIGIGAMDTGRTNSPQTIHTLLLKNEAVSTSGDTEQFVVIRGKRYSHVIDPRTGIGLEERLQVTIVGHNATDTDSFGKVVSVLGVEEGLRIIEAQPGFAALVFRKKGEQVEEFKSRRFKSIPETN